jgi:hypothetical protein
MSQAKYAEGIEILQKPNGLQFCNPFGRVTGNRKSIHANQDCRNQQ